MQLHLLSTLSCYIYSRRYAATSTLDAELLHLLSTLSCHIYSRRYAATLDSNVLSGFEWANYRWPQSLYNASANQTYQRRLRHRRAEAKELKEDSAPLGGVEEQDCSWESGWQTVETIGTCLACLVGKKNVSKHTTIR